MKNPDVASKSKVIKLLDFYGIKALEMPILKNKKTCDIVAQYNKEIYYIEIKDRVGMKEAKEYEITDGYRSSVNKITEKAIKQLNSMPPNKNLFKIIWFLISNDDEEFLFKSVISTIYGIQKLNLTDYNENEIKIDCFYYKPCVFRKYKTPHLVIIQTDSGLTFCINDHSLNNKKLISTRLFSMLKKQNGIINPTIMQQQKACLKIPENQSLDDYFTKVVKQYKLKAVFELEDEVRHIIKSKPFIMKI